MSFAVVGIKLDRAAEVLDGLGTLVALNEDDAHVVMCLGIVGLEPESMLDLLDASSRRPMCISTLPRFW